MEKTVTGKALGQAPGGVSEQAPGDVSEQVSGQATGDAPGKAPEGASRKAPSGARKFGFAVLFCAIGVLVNFLGTLVVSALDLPLYLDSIGTVFAAASGGYISGVAVGYITNLITSTGDPSSFYYCLTSVLIAITAAAMSRRGWFNKLSTTIGSVLVFALIGGGLGSLITCSLYGPLSGGLATDIALQIQGATGMPDIPAQVCGDFLLDIVDKAITVFAAIGSFKLVPSALSKADFSFWQQTPLTSRQLAAVNASKPRSFSLRNKIVVVIGVVMLIIALVTTGISYLMFHRSNIEAQGKMGQGIVSLVADTLDANQVDDYLAKGESTPGYAEAEQRLAEIRDNFPDVQYVYVYQILEDGCHVVFDPDTADEEGSDVGEVVPFDEAFMPYLDALLAGEEIDPIVSDETYGWLLTVYQPLYDDAGNCTCYVAADISMDSLIEDEFAFLIRVINLFAAFFLLICTIVIWLAEYGVILPIKSISLVSSSFAFDTEEEREANVGHLRNLGIRTGDEVEGLYNAVTKTSEDTLQYINEAADKAATIERMQDNLIMVMADLVESRDQHTGDHVRKTAAYCAIILKQMREEGIYADELTDEFMANVVKSAPLHDIGKISVSDTILNKPGRLTDEEFATMQGHTVAGKEILEDAVGAMSDPGYLDEARRLAAYHHEKWNGKGYPYGLAGEDIPLSARIMAVADVFDALVSKRSYKEGMPIEKALQIIHDDAGTHFDPLVAEAFLHAEDEVRRVAEEHGDAHGTAGDIRDVASHD